MARRNRMKYRRSWACLSALSLFKIITQFTKVGCEVSDYNFNHECELRRSSAAGSKDCDFECIQKLELACNYFFTNNSETVNSVVIKPFALFQLFDLNDFYHHREATSSAYCAQWKLILFLVHTFHVDRKLSNDSLIHGFLRPNCEEIRAHER